MGQGPGSCRENRAEARLEADRHKAWGDSGTCPNNQNFQGRETHTQPEPTLEPVTRGHLHGRGALLHSQEQAAVFRSRRYSEGPLGPLSFHR